MWGVKRALHLPTHISDAFLHAPQRDGGLGVFCMRDKIPIIIDRRMQRLRGLTPLLDTVVEKPSTWLNRIKKMIGPSDATTASRNSNRANEFHRSFHGTGLDSLRNHKSCNAYIDNPPRYWSGEDYVRAVQFRSNTLRTAGLP